MPPPSRPSQEALGSLSTCATSCLTSPSSTLKGNQRGEWGQDAAHKCWVSHDLALFLLPRSWHLSSIQWA